MTTGALPAPPTSSGLVAQSEEQPVVCGKAEGASPFESAIFYRSVAQSSERPAWDREVAGENPAVPTNLNLLPWSNTSGIRLLSGTKQVKILPAAPLPVGVKVARRFVKPHGAGASPALAANPSQKETQP